MGKGAKGAKGALLQPLEREGQTFAVSVIDPIVPPSCLVDVQNILYAKQGIKKVVQNKNW